MTLGEARLPAGAVRLLCFVWGCLWGSFANVVVYRLPKQLSVVRPASHCPSCGAAVKPYDNLPIVSWLLLRGRARCCGARISPRYAVIELLGGGLGLAVGELTLLTAPASTPLAHALSAFLSDFGLAMALVAAGFIDAAHMYLPDTITLGATLFGLVTPALRGLSFWQTLEGAAIGFAVVWLPLVVGYKALRGRAGMGLGDAKLVMLAGAWFGWPGALFALFAGAVQATLAVLAIVAAHGHIEEPESVRADRETLQQAALSGDPEAQQLLRDDPLAVAPGQGLMAARLPFGPFLCLATIEWMLAGDWIRERISWLSG